MGWKIWVFGIVAIGVVVAGRGLNKQYGCDKDAIMEFLKRLSDQLGIWAIPAYVGVHTLTLALCLPSAVFFEAGASLLFGFLPAVICVFSAKLLAASLSFWIGRHHTLSFRVAVGGFYGNLRLPFPITIQEVILGRLMTSIYSAILAWKFIFTKSTSAMQWVQGNKHFHVLAKGVEHDGWKFVLLARFSPVPSYVINYALAATKVRFFVDFLLPTIIGCLPMILQNTSIGSLAGAAVASASGSQKSHISSYIFPLIGILSSILISFRIRMYCKNISVESSPIENISNSENTSDSSQVLTSSKEDKNVRKRQ